MRGWDFACLHFDELPGVTPVRLYRAPALAGMLLQAVGFQRDKSLRLDCIRRLTVRSEQRSRGQLSAVQLNGGAPPGFSGSPVVVKSGPDVFIVGMLWLGGEGAATSRMLAADLIASLLEEHASEVMIADLPPLPYNCLRIPSSKWESDIHGPAAMLVPKFEVVPFRGRKRELASLASWAQAERRLGIRVYHERGGVGKTRLAIEACKLLANRNFRTGFLARDTSLDSLRELFSVTEETRYAGLFMVVDYAETDYVALQNVISASNEFPRVRLRMLLLARGTGDWWEMARAAGESLGDILSGPATEEPIALGPVALSAEARRKEFSRAVSAFAKTLGRKIPAVTGIDFDSPLFERALLLHTYALFAVLGIPLKARQSKTSDPILAALWGRERRFLQTVFRSRGIGSTLCSAAEMTLAAISAIGRAIDAEDAIAILNSIPSLKGVTLLEARAVTEVLHDAYGGENWIDPLQPDILGEYVFARTFGDSPGDANAVLNR